MKEGLVAKLGFLKSEQQSASVVNAVWICADGGGDVWNEGAALDYPDTVNGIRLHDEICVAIPKLGLESGEEVILTLGPCDDDLDT